MQQPRGSFSYLKPLVWGAALLVVPPPPPPMKRRPEGGRTWDYGPLLTGRTHTHLRARKAASAPALSRPRFQGPCNPGSAGALPRPGPLALTSASCWRWWRPPAAPRSSVGRPHPTWPSALRSRGHQLPSSHSHSLRTARTQPPGSAWKLLEAAAEPPGLLFPPPPRPRPLPASTSGSSSLPPGASVPPRRTLTSVCSRDPSNSFGLSPKRHEMLPLTLSLLTRGDTKDTSHCFPEPLIGHAKPHGSCSLVDWPAG